MIELLENTLQVDTYLEIRRQAGFKKLTKEQAEEMLKPADAEGELSDDDLDSVAGGINMPDWAIKYGSDALKLLKFLF